MVTTHRDGSITAEVSQGDDVIIGIVMQDEDGYWPGDCSFCPEGFMRLVKSATVDALEDHFTLKHATPDL